MLSSNICFAYIYSKRKDVDRCKLLKHYQIKYTNYQEYQENQREIGSERENEQTRAREIDKLCNAFKQQRDKIM